MYLKEVVIEAVRRDQEQRESIQHKELVEMFSQLKIVVEMQRKEFENVLRVNISDIEKKAELDFVEL
jgi:hypothetical protein